MEHFQFLRNKLNWRQQGVIRLKFGSPLSTMAMTEEGWGCDVNFRSQFGDLNFVGGESKN